MLVAAVIEAIIKLIEWLNHRKKPLTDRQKKKLSEVLMHCRDLDNQLANSGIYGSWQFIDGERKWVTTGS